MPDLASQPAYEIARRLDLRGERSYAWIVAVKPFNDADTALDDLCEELAAVTGSQPRVLDVTGLLPDDVVAAARATGLGPLILCGLDQRSDDFWQALDINRSGLERSYGMVFWLSAAALARLCTYAPNIRSYVGGSIYQVSVGGGVMSETERVSRLRDLRQYFGFGDEELLRRATAGELSPNPRSAEWLILLGRGDLI